MIATDIFNHEKVYYNSNHLFSSNLFVQQTDYVISDAPIKLIVFLFIKSGAGYLDFGK